MIERTLSNINPEAVQRGHIGEILRRFEAHKLKIVAARVVKLNREQAEGFYAVHRERPFYGSLTQYMASGPVLVSVLEGEDAIKKNREIMGATDPVKAAPGTIRRDWGTDLERNAVHGSDGQETAAWEIAFFFKPDDIHS